MENSPERGRDPYTNSCLFDQVIKVFLKCLGQDSSNEQAEGCPLEEGLSVESSRAIRIKRPPRPPVSCGAGAQFNSSAA